MKNPDALDEAIDDTLANETFGLTDEDEIETIRESRAETLRDKCGEWMEYGEYITVLFDTEEGTATVQKPNK